MLPAAARLPEARRHIARRKYFVVHAPRQTGKTTTLAALARVLTAEGEYVAVHFTCEVAGPAGDDYPAVQRAILDSLRAAARNAGLAPELLPPDPWPVAEETRLLWAGLEAWAAQCPKPLVLFFDEIDSLSGPSLESVLRQLRAGYNARPAPFPDSVVLCGMRDVRDYKIASGGDPARLGSASPFNVKVASLRLGDFTFDEVRELYGQHTADTGQPFTGDAVTQAFDYTRGQPWLVNALAAEIIDTMQVTSPIEAGHVEQAKERLIQARATHLDSLVSRLYEPRVQQVVQPLIAGEIMVTDDTYQDDVAYLRDLGLLAPGKVIEIANPIYHEVIVRVLSDRVEGQVAADPRSFVLPDGRLDFPELLRQFADFWRQNAEVLVKGTIYHEVAPQLVMMAFIHRIVNGGGYVDREYGLGYRRVDLVVRWPYQDEHGKQVWQWEAVELKVWHPSDSTDPTGEGLRQLDAYLDRLNLDHGSLVVFDRRPEAPPLAERITFSTGQTPTGRPVALLRA
jgi:hypothetical protein